ncbi:MAG: bifunctional diaminohydroxyphosphoribosylaminopyrimidine deaminase/5-amino-6-(5-phosphoribosylamino)uracil reductase RibD [Desulfobacteraceae bacterium]
MKQGSDERFMWEALRLARKGLGRTSPNPAVGAVVVREGRIAARGFHRRAGEPHAEVEALNRLEGPVLGGDTLYVTLEPCNHTGRTPPCTRFILERGIKRVVVGMRDPNPRVAGGGCEYLRQHGVEVKEGVLEQPCLELNEAFIKHVRTGRPFVSAKSAATLDGWIATATGHSRWVTGERARRFVHTLRDRTDAVLVGVGTVLADDPSLTTRIPGKRGKDPIRVIADTGCRTPEKARLLNLDSDAETWIAVSEDLSPKRTARLEGLHKVSLLRCPTKEGRLEPGALMDILGARGITSVLLEGGAALMGSMVRSGLVDKFYIFKAPKLLAGGDGVPMASGPGARRMDRCLGLRDIRVRRFGSDVLIQAYPAADVRDTQDKQASCSPD